MENWKNISQILTSYNENKAEQEDKLYQIYEYIEDDNKKGIVKILKSGININSEYDGSTPLMKCLDYNQLAIAEYLVKFAGANPNFREGNEEGPLWYSIRNQKMDFFHLFMDTSPNLPKGNNNQVALIEATKFSNFIMVEKLLANKKVKVNQKDGYGNTALHYALAKNPLTDDDMDICRLLLAAGADQSSMNVSGETPGKTNEDSMANSILFEDKLKKELDAQDELKLKAQLEAEMQLTNTNDLEIEYEEVMELDPVSNTMKPVLRPKPKPRPLPKPTPGNTRRKI